MADRRARTYKVELPDGTTVTADVSPESLAVAARVKRALDEGRKPARSDIAELMRWAAQDDEADELSDLPPTKIRMASAPAGFDALEQRGCGAWVSNHGCGAVPADLVVGQTELFFATYLNASDGSGATYTFLCARHNPANGPAGLIADMRPDVLRLHRRELREAFKLMGRKLGTPNLLGA